MSHRVRYKLSNSYASGEVITDYFNSLADLMLGDDNHGEVIKQVKAWCGHWKSKVHYDLHTIELYEIAEYLEEWGVDTLDSKRFLVYTDGTNISRAEPDMLKILERKVATK